MILPASSVLLVEDDPKVAEVLAGLLQDDNITLASAEDAAPLHDGAGTLGLREGAWDNGTVLPEMLA